MRGQREIKRASFFKLALGPDATGVGLHDVFDDGESESRAAEFATARLVNPVERSKTCGRCSAAIPGPSSATMVSMNPFFSSARMVTWPPDGVYLIALSSRLKRT